MHYRQLGSSGVRVSEVGLGTDQFGPRVGEAAVREILAAAADAGINLLDTAGVYGQGLSEEYIGAALRGQRHAFVIATKGGQRMGPGTNETGSSRVHLMKALEDSLRRLNTDYVDLYQIHLYDSHTPMQELMRTLDEMVSSGKVRYVGASNFAAWQLCRCNDIAEMHGWEPFITIQPHYHLLEREVEAEILPYCRAFGVGVLPYFPLAAGLLTGRYTLEGDPPADTRAAANEGARRYIDRYRTPENWRIIEQLAAFAKSRDYTLTELAIAWLLAEPLVSSVIAGVSRVAHVLANARAARWRLSAEELTEVGGILEGRAACISSDLRGRVECWPNR